MSPLPRVPKIPGERRLWLAGAPGFEPRNGGIKIRFVCMIYQGPFRKIAEIGLITRQEVSSHFGMPCPSGRGCSREGSKADSAVARLWGRGVVGTAPRNETPRTRRRRYKPLRSPKQGQ